MTKIRNIFKSKPKSDENLSKSKPTFAVFRVKSKPTNRKTVSNPKQVAYWQRHISYGRTAKGCKKKKSGGNVLPPLLNDNA